MFFDDYFWPIFIDHCLSTFCRSFLVTIVSQLLLTTFCYRYWPTFMDHFSIIIVGKLPMVVFLVTVVECCLATIVSQLSLTFFSDHYQLTLVDHFPWLLAINCQQPFSIVVDWLSAKAFVNLWLSFYSDCPRPKSSIIVIELLSKSLRTNILKLYIVKNLVCNKSKKSLLKTLLKKEITLPNGYVFFF